MKKIVLIIIITMLISCAETKRHEILGTNYGWDASGIEILLDAQIDELRIRHVRMKDRVKNCNSGYSEHIEIAGIIGPDSTAAVKRLLPKLHKCIYNERGDWFVNVVYLSSGGGFLHDGYEMGKLFRKYGVQTIITGGQECSSSCAIAFLGGKYRGMEHDSKLMFHAPYLTDGVAINCSDQGQVAGLKNYYQAHLGDKDGLFLLERTMNYCSASSGWTINADAAKLFNITTY